MVFAGAVSGTSPVIADIASADPYIDRLAEAADTPTLNWADCGDGFLCATAVVPLNYHHPNDEQIDLAVIKLPATDPGRRMGTLFVNFGGPGQSASIGCVTGRGGHGCSPTSCDPDSISCRGIRGAWRAAQP